MMDTKELLKLADAAVIEALMREHEAVAKHAVWHLPYAPSPALIEAHAEVERMLNKEQE